MVDALANESFFDDLESRLRSLIGTQIEVEISELDPLFLEYSGVFSEGKITHRVPTAK